MLACVSGWFCLPCLPCLSSAFERAESESAMPVEPISLTSSMEDYLEAIFLIVAERKVARVKEIAEALGVRMGSVTGALRTLSDKGLVDHDKFGYVDLTEKGAEAAGRIVRRHEVITSFLFDVLGVDPEVAEEVACKMEHSVGKVVTDRLVCLAEFLQTCPRAGREWLAKFHDVCEKGIQPEQCERCVRECKAGLGKARAAAEGQIETVAADLKEGQRAAVISVKGRGPIKRRLMDMGLVPSSVLEILQVAPLGDPIEIKLKGYRLALRREEAARVVVRRL